jgi:imidazolonepropionase
MSNAVPRLTETNVFSDGKIAAIGSTQYVKELWKDDAFEEVIDATGKCVLPGFVDAHTHPVWAGDRLHEFAMKVLQFKHSDIKSSQCSQGVTVVLEPK